MQDATVNFDRIAKVANLLHKVNKPGTLNFYAITRKVREYGCNETFAHGAEWVNRYANIRFDDPQIPDEIRLQMSEFREDRPGTVMGDEECLLAMGYEKQFYFEVDELITVVAIEPEAILFVRYNKNIYGTMNYTPVPVAESSALFELLAPKKRELEPVNAA